MNFSPALPLELQCLVIGFAGTDKMTLLRASTTCKVWRAECYRHLFSSLELNHASIGSFSSLLSDRFTELTISPCVRRLSVNLHRKKSCADGCPLDGLDHIMKCLSRAAKVRALVVSNVCSMDSKVYSLLSSNFPKIYSLDVSNSSFAALTEFIGFISSYGQVEKVHLKGINCPTSLPILPFTPPPGTYVLQVSSSSESAGSGFCMNMQWRSQTLVERPMQLQHLAIISLSHMGNINTVLQSLGSSLHSIEFVYPFQNDAHQTSPYHIDLRPATHLYHLSLGFPDRVLGVMPWILCILHRLSGYSLRVLRIYFSASRQFTLDLPFLRFLEKILRGCQFRRLELIHFLAFHSLGDEEVKRLVVRHTRDALVGWHREGKLKFSFLG